MKKKGKKKQRKGARQQNIHFGKTGHCVNIKKSDKQA